VVFVFLLIGTHFSDETEFPAVDAAGNLPHAWARHNLVTACDWSPTSRWAHFLTGGVNAHAAHHLFPAVCHTHYRALADIIVVAADEFGVPYHRTTLPGMVRSHFAFLRRMGTRPGGGEMGQRTSETAMATPGNAATSAVSPGRRVRTSA
jgi:linoleoyl-CoA desaturase